MRRKKGINKPLLLFPGSVSLRGAPFLGLPVSLLNGRGQLWFVVLLLMPLQRKGIPHPPSLPMIVQFEEEAIACHEGRKA